METKHTPGPWRLEAQFDDDVTAEIYGANGEGPLCEIAPVLGEWGDDEIANAYLMAAAPDLLLQLKALVVQIEHSPMLTVPPNVYSAIAKAEGR